MGAWGEGPMDNDSAHDLVYGVVQPAIIKLLVKETKPKWTEHETRAAARLVVTLYKAGLFIPYAGDGYVFVETLRDKLILIREDKQWVENWVDSAAIKRSLSTQIRQLNKILRDHDA